MGLKHLTENDYPEGSVFDKTAAPTVNDDIDLGFLIGSRWVDTTNDKEYICLDNTDGAALWKETTQSGGGGGTNLSLGPVTSTTIDVNSDTGTDATIPSANATDAGVMPSADKVKLDNITVTQAVDLDTIESDTATNNSKVSADGLVTTHSDVDSTTTAVLQNNLNASVAPTATDDTGSGYAVGSIWLDTTADKAYRCLDATTVSAVWIETTQSGGGGGTNLSIGPVTATTLDVSSDTGTDATIPSANATDAGVMSSADKVKLDGIENSADVTDTANVDAAGAVMNSDSSTSAMGFVIDEDTMVSDLDTKVPTQQSVKAYVDGVVASSVEYQGGYDANTNTPDLDVSPSGITKGDMYTVTVAGTFFSTPLEVGDVLISEQDNPTLESHWTVVNKDLDAASIKTSYESNADTNAFDDAEQSKLAGIESNATADQTGAEIKVAYEAEANTNAFTDAEQTKLTGIESNATADQTGAEIKIAYEGETNTNAFTDAEQTKLSGIETAATADQTDGEIKTAYENNANTNAFTDAEQTKLGNQSGTNTGDEVDFAGSGANGLVPDPITETGKFLKDDGTWAAIAGGGDLLAANNLSDVASAATSRSNLGLDTTANQTDSTNKRFMTDAQETKLDGITGTNTGDEVDATTTVKGIVEKSTSAENVAGTSDLVYPTVAGTKEMIDTHAAGGSAEIDAQNAGATADSAITSTTFVDMDSMTLTTSNTAATDYIIVFSAEVSAGNNRSLELRISVNGAVDLATVRERDFTGATKGSISVNLAIAGVGNGQVIKIQWRKSAGSSTVTVHERTLSIYGVN